MFITHVAYDYYKGLVTAFIEINGQPETIFGKPPMRLVLPVVNFMAVFESLCWLAFLVLLIVYLAVFSPVQAWFLFVTFIPMYLMFGLFLIGMIFIYLYFVIAMFRYAKSIPWIIVFIFLLPIAFVNVLIFFGMPLLFMIIFPIQHLENSPIQEPRLWQVTIYIFIGLIGAVLKGFVRPTEDEENPFSSNRMSVPQMLCYFGFIFLLEVFVILVTINVDKKLLFIESVTVNFPSWAISFIPVFLIFIMGSILFGVKAFLEWKLVIKQHDPNGDGWLKAVSFTGLIVFLMLFVASSILAILVADGIPVPWPVAPVPFLVGFILILVLTLLPWFDLIKKRICGPGKGNSKIKRNAEDPKAENFDQVVQTPNGEPPAEGESSGGGKKKKKKHKSKITMITFL